jgi:type I restriction enzyme M protein
VKTSVLFFDKRSDGPPTNTKQLWIYGLQTSIRLILKQNPPQFGDLSDFIECYHAENRQEQTATWSESNSDGRWRMFTCDELMMRDRCLDFSG